MKNTFTKQDLLTGDIVVFRDGALGFVITEMGIILAQNNGYEELNNYQEDLSYYVELDASDILEVYRACRLSFFDFKGVSMFDFICKNMPQ